ncbi:MAG: hypothetical protein D6707_11825, partial [Bacteroidetes bacterium]
MRRFFLIFLGFIFLAISVLAQDRKKADSLLELYREAFYPEQKIYFLRQAIPIINKESPDRALFLCNELLQTAKKSGNRELLALAYSVLAEVYYDNSDFDNAILYYKQGLEILNP